MPKDKNKPKGKMSAYACFVQECRREHEKKYPNKQVVFTEFSQKCASRWKTMNDDEKKRFQDLAEEDKRRYEADMAKYVPPKGAEGGRRKRKKKDPNAPKRAMSAFFMYCADARPKVRAAHPDFQVGEIAKILGKQWKAISEAEKAKYEKKAQTEKARYQKELAEYKRSGGGASPAKKGRPAKKAPPPKRVEEEDDDDEDEDDEEEEEEEDEDEDDEEDEEDE
ncbi:high mobility group protein DSP1-like [Branchiostoma floridae x Branchiostoma belcheri]